ncbi:MAG: hypothetical protein JWR85_3169 [Marmoricola sp.]|nr:hypothetical protein [Marmoricola sp.]
MHDRRARQQIRTRSLTGWSVVALLAVVVVVVSVIASNTADDSSSKVSQIPQALVDGVRFGLIIATAAIGLSLIFGTTKLINFAHGELITLGAVVAWYVQSHAVPLWIAGLVAAAAGAAFGGILESALWRPLRRRRTGLFQLLIISLGLSLALRHIYLIIFGGANRAYRSYRIQDTIHFGGVSITPRDIGLILISLALLGGVAWTLQNTPIGQAMRAVADNRDLAEASGISVKRVILVVWMLGSALAAVSGVLLGLDGGVTWDMGFSVLLLVFAAVILGGLGKAYGAMVGGVLIGVVSQVSTLYSPPELRVFWALLVLIVVLLVRPEGILGTRHTTRVG